jgi:hypothetical protein
MVSATEYERVLVRAIRAGHNIQNHRRKTIEFSYDFGDLSSKS